jgi:adenosylcobinamide-GDP ribazoletransferase
MRSALQFLTIVPVSAPSTPPGRTAWAFPIVGAVLGLVASAVLPLPMGSILALLLVTAITGGLHEDGLADVCDALRSYRTREHMHQIMKDSRIGAHGALALLFSVLFRWQALTHIQGIFWFVVPAAYGLSRASIVMLAACSRSAGDGLGAAFVRTLPRNQVWFVAIQSLMLASLAGGRATALLIVANAAAIALCRAWFHRRLGGITGDCMGFQCQISEAVSLWVLTWG